MTTCVRISSRQRAVLLHGHQLRLFDDVMVQVTNVAVTIFSAPEHLSELRSDGPVDLVYLFEVAMMKEQRRASVFDSVKRSRRLVDG